MWAYSRTYGQTGREYGTVIAIPTAETYLEMISIRAYFYAVNTQLCGIALYSLYNRASMMIDRTSPRAGKIGAPRSTDVTFPANSLEECIELAKVVANEGPVDPIDLAARLGLKRNTYFRRLLTAAHRYGLVNGSHMAKQVRITDLGRRIAFPTDEASLRADIIRAANTPPLFRKIHQRHDRRRFPSERFFGNALIRDWGVPAEAMERCREVFMSNAKGFDLIGEGGVLRAMDAQLLTDAQAGGGEAAEHRPSPARGAGSDAPPEPLGGADRPEAPGAGAAKAFLRAFVSLGGPVPPALKAVLDFGAVECVQREGPSSYRTVFDAIRRCDCAIIRVGAAAPDGGESRAVDPGTLLEIGAALACHDGRVILLTDGRAGLPDGTGHVPRCNYSGGEMSPADTMLLLQTLAGFKSQLEGGAPPGGT